jgi:hypothetical protein
VYETPGTYVAQLTVLTTIGTLVYEKVTITVEDPDAVFYGTNTICVSDAASNDFTGCPSGAETIATNSLAGMSSWVADGRRVLLRRGSTWGTDVALIGNTRVTKSRIGAYGTCDASGANGICSNAPQINSTAGSSLFSLTYKNDLVIQDLSFSGTKTINSGTVLDGAVDISRCLFLRNKVEGFNSAVTWSHFRTESFPTSPKDMAVVDCDIRNFYSYGFYGGGENLAFMGNDVHNSDVTHITRVWWAYKGVISHNVISGSSLTNTAGRAALKFHGPKSTDATDGSKDAEVGTLEETGDGGLPYSSQYAVISDNIFGSSGPWPVDIRPQNGQSDERIYDIIFERNLISQDFAEKSSSVQWSIPLKFQAYYASVRNNIIDWSFADGAPKGGIGVDLECFEFMPPHVGQHFYHNTIYANETETFVNQIKWFHAEKDCGTDNYIYNNLVSAPGVSGEEVVVFDESGNIKSNNNISVDSAYLADPDNVDPTLRNYSLTVLSPLSIRDAGTSVVDASTPVPIFEDFNRQPRNRMLLDIGADEYDNTSAITVEGETNSTTGECSSGSALISQTVADLSNINFSSESDAQSFSWLSDFNLYSISFNIVTNRYTSGFKMRIGTSSDLSGTCGSTNTCIEEIELTPSAAGVYEAVSSSHPMLYAGTIYYFALTSMVGDAINISYNSTNVEIAGVGQRYKTPLTGTFNNDVSRSTQDLYFIIKACD